MGIGAIHQALRDMGRLCARHQTQSGAGAYHGEIAVQRMETVANWLVDPSARRAVRHGRGLHNRGRIVGKRAQCPA